MQPNNDNPYEFIFGQGKQPSPSKFQPRSNSSKILLSIGFVAGVIIVLIVGFSLISSIGKAGNDDLVLVRQEQTELSRVLDSGLKNVSSSAIKNTLASLQLSLASDSTSLKSLLDKRGVEIEKAVLESKKDAATDKSLETALQNGSYDTVFLKTVNTLAGDYYASLKAAKLDVETKAEKDLLDSASKNLETYEATQQ